MGIPPFTSQDKQDAWRAIMVIIIFLGLGFLVYAGKLDSTVIVGFIGGVGGYYFKGIEGSAKQNTQ